MKRLSNMEDKTPYQAKKVDTLGEIEKILSEYFRNAPNMGIDELLNLRDKLAIHSYRLAEFCADAKTSYNVSYFNKKITVNRSQQAMMQKEKLSAAKSLILSEIAHEELLEEELLSEALAYKHDILLKQTNRVLDAMSQRISHLKREDNDTKNQGSHRWNPLEKEKSEMETTRNV